jgi:hypothetical protein
MKRRLVLGRLVIAHHVGERRGERVGLPADGIEVALERGAGPREAFRRPPRLKVSSGRASAAASASRDGKVSIAMNSGPGRRR